MIFRESKIDLTHFFSEFKEMFIKYYAEFMIAMQTDMDLKSSWIQLWKGLDDLMSLSYF